MAIGVRCPGSVVVDSKDPCKAVVEASEDFVSFRAVAVDVAVTVAGTTVRMDTTVSVVVGPVCVMVVVGPLAV